MLLQNLHKLATIEMIIPDHITEEIIVEYIEKLTNLFVISYKIIDNE